MIIRGKVDSMPEAKPDKRQFLVHLEPSLTQTTKIIAVTRGTTASAVARQALKELIERIPQEDQRLTFARRSRSR